MTPLIFEAARVGDGTLCIMPKPDGYNLEEAIAYFRLLGINRVVSLLETHEIKRFSLEKEGSLCERKGIAFTHFPITDSQLPQDLKTFQLLVKGLHAELTQGGNIAIHCRAGIGRTGMLAACILRRDGHDPDNAIQILSQARGFPIPETDQQHDFILDFEL